MKVKNLIRELLEMPMDSEVLIAIKDDCGEYKYSVPCILKKYEDDQVGMICTKGKFL